MRARLYVKTTIASLAVALAGCGDSSNPVTTTDDTPAPAAKGSAKVGAIVTGHWEGSPGGHGEVCVTTGATTDCHPFTTTNGAMMVVVPPGKVAATTVTVHISDQEVGGLVTAVDQFSDVGAVCENLPVLGTTGFTPCAHPDYLEGPVKRFNLMINSSAGGPFDPRGGNPDDGGK